MYVISYYYSNDMIHNIYIYIYINLEMTSIIVNNGLGNI